MVILLATAIALILVLAARADAASSPQISKRACVYSAESINELDAFGALVGRQMNCAMVYNDAVTTWQQWDHPWFVNYVNAPDYDWSQWVAQDPGDRQLIITEDLFPQSLAGSGWLAAGAAGRYTQYARILAQDLVSAGLGGSVIRLAPEANGTWFEDSYGSSPAQWTLWRRFWDRTVAAMRSVTGAHFQFDWCVSVMYRDLPLSEIYPGNSYVDIIGMDIYDDGALGSTGDARWQKLMSAPDGIQAVLDLARAENRPISIPEWGVNTVTGGGFGDDPAFVDGIADLVKNNPTAYQSYFYKYGQQTQLAPGTQSLAAYRSRFGPGAHQASRARRTGHPSRSASRSPRREKRGVRRERDRRPRTRG